MLNSIQNYCSQSLVIGISGPLESDSSLPGSSFTCESSLVQETVAPEYTAMSASNSSPLSKHDHDGAEKAPVKKGLYD